MSRILTVTVNPSIDIEVTVERLAPTHKLRCKNASRHPGGGGVNVARVLKRLGGDVRALLATGGATGDLLKALITREGVSSRFFELSAETRENMTVREETTGLQYRFVLPGPEFSESEWRTFLDVVADEAAHAEMIVASGSLAPGAPVDFYARCAHLARQRNAFFLLDASGPALASALIERPDLIKPSLSEFEGIIGHKLSDEAEMVEAARGLISTGKANAIALTLGEKGALLITQESFVRASALAVPATSTVGAGDSFLAGVAWRLSEKDSLVEALRFGVSAATASLLQAGTQLCDVADVQRLAPQVILETR